MSDEVVSTDRTVNIPDKCPRCGKPVMTIGEGTDKPLSFRCSGGCGKLYYDKWLDIWRIDWDYDCDV